MKKVVIIILAVIVAIILTPFYVLVYLISIGALNSYEMTTDILNVWLYTEEENYARVLKEHEE